MAIGVMTRSGCSTPQTTLPEVTSMSDRKYWHHQCSANGGVKEGRDAQGGKKKSYFQYGQKILY